MKKIVYTLTLLTFMLACKEEINITAPIILIENTSVSVLDTVIINVEQYVDIDGDRINADYFEWYIENSDGEVIADDFPDSETIVWVPQESGYFLIKVKIGYNKNKSITTIKEITVMESVASLQKKIIGHWKGTGTRRYNGVPNGNWGIDLYIDNKGHYYGQADYYEFDPYCEKGVFNTERLDFDNGNYIDSCGIPGNIPCQRLEITGIENNKGFGIFWGGWGYVYIDQYNYNCSDVYDIEDLEISSDGKQLYFEFNNRGADDYYEWEKKFMLTKQ
jgi:hypothetical protein